MEEKNKEVKQHPTMNISHLMVKGFVTDQITQDNFKVKFRSLKTSEVQNIDRAIMMDHGAQESRVSTTARNNRYLASAIMEYSVMDGDRKIAEADFTEMAESECIGAITSWPSFVYNKIFSMYREFEQKVVDIISGVPSKN